jgi:hypothetical protein
MSHLNLDDPLVRDALCQTMLRETEEYLARHLSDTEAPRAKRLADRLAAVLDRRPSCEAVARTQSPHDMLRYELAFHA